MPRSAALAQRPTLRNGPPVVAPGPARPETILVVDDDALAARRLHDMLCAHGYAVRVATSLGQALVAFDDQVVDLVLMDAVMPRIDGFKLTRILRQRMATYVPIVFVTAQDDAAARTRGAEVGADDMLGKPVDGIELRLRAQAMLRIRALTRALAEQAQAMQRLADLDGLTGVPNRRSLEAFLEQEWARAERYDRDLSVVLLDLDHFKQINDVHGHMVGDDFLRFFARLAVQQVRETDRVFRYGGEEFVVLLPETRLDEATAVAERIRAAVERQSGSATSAGRQTVSMGLSSRRLADVNGPAALLQTADRALYGAKSAGRNRWHLHLPPT